MKKLLKFFALSEEALLLDSRLYIVKAALAIATGYLVGKNMPIAHIDMISVLLGVMYNLEPINLIGIKGGISQLVASTLGAMCTGLLISFAGINVFTIALAMALTLYISLKIDWRMVSPVAIFTSIYMTQYVQSTAAGDPSIWLTFRLRIVALGTGIAIAILFNFIFSYLYYKKIDVKRETFARNRVIDGFRFTVEHLSNLNIERSRSYIGVFPGIFNDLDMVYSNILVMQNESRFMKADPQIILKTQTRLQLLRDISHLLYDINYVASTKEIPVNIDEMIRNLNLLIEYFENGIERDIIISCDADERICSNVAEIKSDIYKYYS